MPDLNDWAPPPAPGAGALALGRLAFNPPSAPAQANPYAMGDAFAQHYAGMPTHDVVRRMQAGEPVQTNAGATNAAPLSPEAAGQQQQTMPGSMGGSNDTGVPAAEGGMTLPPPPPAMHAGGSADFDEKTGTYKSGKQPAPRPQLPPPPGAAPPPPAPAGAPVLPPPPAGPPPTITPSVPTPPMTAAAGTLDTGAQEAAAAPPPPPGAAAMSAAAQGQEPAAAPIAPPGAPPGATTTSASGATPSTVTWGGAQVTLPSGMTQQQFNALTPEKRWEIVNRTYKAPAELATISGAKDIDFTKYPPHVRDVVSRAMMLQSQIDNYTSQNLGSAASPRALQQLKRLQVALGQETQKLGKWGINLQSAATPGGGTGGDPGGGGSTGGGTGGGAGGGTGGTVDDAIGDPDVVGTPDNPGGNTDVSDIDPTTQQGSMALLNKLYEKYGDKAIAIFEALQSAANQTNIRNDKQSSVDLLTGGLQSYEEDPAYKAIGSIAGNIAANPDPVDWEQKKNQYSALQGAGVKTANDALASSARRRGVSPVGVAGIAGEIGRVAANDRAMGLGQLDIQESESKRDREIQAMQANVAALQATKGFEQGQLTNIGNLMNDHAANDVNWAGGMAAAFQNIDAAKAAADAAKSAGGFSWKDAAGLVGTIGGAFLGGPAGAAVGGALVGSAVK